MMRKFLILITILAGLVACKGNTEQKEPGYVLFSGHIANTNESFMKMSNNGKVFEKEVKIDAQGNFSDTLQIGQRGSFFYSVGKSYSVMYLKPGDNMHVELNADDFFKATVYSGKGSKVNNYNIARLTLKAELVGDAKVFFVVPVDDFLKKIEKNKQTFLDLLAKTDLEDEDRAIQKKIINNDYLLTRNNYDKFYSYHMNVHPEVPANYYDPIKTMDMDDEEAFSYDQSYRNLITENWRLNLKDEQEKDPNLSVIAQVENQIKDIKSAKIRDHIASMLFKQMSLKNENYRDDYPRIMALLTSEDMKANLTGRYNSVNTTQPEMAAPDFNYENFKGGKTALADLKGKILYVEIWATWCGPCIKEMPALTQLIEDYEGKNIEFVSISIDSKNDYDKWRAMVPDKNVGGVQLLADKGLESDFMKAFSVGLIPRSILLDEEGKIISHAAPRPSAANTKTVIDSLLSEKTTSTMMIKTE